MYSVAVIAACVVFGQPGSQTADGDAEALSGSSQESCEPRTEKVAKDLRQTAAAGDPLNQGGHLSLDPRATEFEKIEQIDSSHWRSARGCGVNALYGYLKLHGRDVSLSDIAEAVPTGPNGATMEQLRAAAARFGLPSQVVFCRPADLVDAPKPCILHTIEQGSVGHFVVLLGTRANEEHDFSVADFTVIDVKHYSRGIISRIASGYVLMPVERNAVAMRAFISFAIVAFAGCCLLWRHRIGRIRK